MIAHLKVMLRYILVLFFGALGGALVNRGFLTEAQAGLLLENAFIEAAATFAASGLVFLWYLVFSESAKANAAWAEVTEAENFNADL